MEGFCHFCLSSKIKKSYAYPDMYFCEGCKNGDKLDTIIIPNQFWQPSVASKDSKTGSSGTIKGTVSSNKDRMIRINLQKNRSKQPEFDEEFNKQLQMFEDWLNDSSNKKTEEQEDENLDSGIVDYN